MGGRLKPELLQDVLAGRDSVLLLLSEHKAPVFNLKYEMSLYCLTTKSALLCYFNLSDLSISGLRQRWCFKALTESFIAVLKSNTNRGSQIQAEI